jgi:hypothetical protein
MINMVGCSVNYFSTMGDLDSCLPRIVNQLELDAKTWKQGLTLRCFLAKTNPQPKALHIYESAKYIPLVG